MLLFLDIDGVTHPVFPRADLPDAENLPFSYLPRLEAVLREFPAVKIVIASDWRKYHPLAELRRMFAEDLHFRIVGVIGIDDTDHEPGNRQRLVERYLAERNLSESAWLAIDDDASNYLPGAALVLCDDGFRDAEEHALRAALSGRPFSVLASGRRLSPLWVIGIARLPGIDPKAFLSSTARRPSISLRKGEKVRC